MEDLKVVKDKYNYRNVIQHPQQGTLPPNTGFVCWTCHQHYTHQPVGIPVAFHESNELDDSGKYQIKYNYSVENRYCTFQCVLYWLRHWKESQSSNDTKEVLLRQLYHQLYPEEQPLKPCKDPRLLIGNGGSLSHEEWSRSTSCYFPIRQIVVGPARTEFLVTGNNKVLAA